MCHGGGGTEKEDVRFQFLESDSLMCLDALLFLNVNLTLNFYVISVQNASRNDQGLYSMDDWAVVQLLLFWIKNQVTNTFKRMMILIKTEKQCNVSSTNMKK